jgi:hypothetical protein
MKPSFKQEHVLATLKEFKAEKKRGYLLHCDGFGFNEAERDEALLAFELSKRPLRIFGYDVD